jgi:hypothetical protein
MHPLNTDLLPASLAASKCRPQSLWSTRLDGQAMCGESLRAILVIEMEANNIKVFKGAAGKDPFDAGRR